MKYLAIGSWCPEDWAKIIERAKVSFAERDEGTDKYPEFLFQPHSLIGKHKAFTVYEGTPEQLTNVANHWVGLVNWEFIPIIEVSKTMELYEKRVK